MVEEISEMKEQMNQHLLHFLLKLQDNSDLSGILKEEQKSS
jgi:hypothetical protein